MNERMHVSIRNLNVSYGNTRILKDISIDIPDQKITVIIGPSGCGKSTLLKSMNMLLDLQTGITVSGEVFLDGVDIYAGGIDPIEVRRKIGLLAQRPCVLPMSIYDNVCFGPRIHGMKDRRRLEETVRHHLKEVGLWEEVGERLREPASALSIGQQQRLCLARGLAVEPEVVLCDEPTSALDPRSSRTIEEKLLSLKNDYTIVLVTHVLRQARRLADYIVFLYEGEVVEQAPADRFFQNPVQTRTYEYLAGVFS